MRTETLHDLFLEELADIYYAEKRIAKEFPKMAKAATCTDLKTTIEDNLKEIDGRVRKLEEVFHAFGERVVGKTCQATKGLLAESDEIAEVFKDSPAINAALIGAAQKNRPLQDRLLRLLARMGRTARKPESRQYPRGQPHRREGRQ